MSSVSGDGPKVTNVKGYASPRPFSGFQVPIPMQSMFIRRYCEERGFTFNHHVVENITPDSYLVLERLVTEATQYQALAMCSIGMLPIRSQSRDTMLQRCISDGLSIHFIFEQLIVSTRDDIGRLNELIRLTRLLDDPRSQIQGLIDLMDHE